MKKIVLIITSGLMFSCSSSKKTSSLSSGSSYVTKTTTTTTVVGPAKVAAQGSSFTNAVVINETNGLKGVDAEYDWIKKSYADYTIDGQSEKEMNGKHYDIIKITTANGQKSDVYFDISKFYGK